VAERAPGPPILVRPAGPRDIPEVLELFRLLDRLQSGWRVFEPRSDPAGEAEARYRRSLGADDSVLLLAERDGPLVGMAFAWVSVPSTMSDERSVELSHVVVDPGVRTIGVGRALVAEAAKWASDQGVRRIVIKTYSPNRDALAFWEAVGFRPRYVQMTAPVSELIPPEDR
jgi:GNAT superfamily N-acetyltransferase